MKGLSPSAPPADAGQEPHALPNDPGRIVAETEPGAVVTRVSLGRQAYAGENNYALAKRPVGNRLHAAF